MAPFDADQLLQIKQLLEAMHGSSPAQKEKDSRPRLDEKKYKKVDKLKGGEK